MVVSIQYFACLLLMTDRSGADVVLWELFFSDHWAHWFIAQQYGTKNLMPNVLYYYYNYTNFSIINTIFWNYFLTQGAKKCLPKHNVTVLTPNHTQSDCHNIFFSILSFIALKLLEFVRVVFFKLPLWSYPLMLSIRWPITNIGESDLTPNFAYYTL